MKPGRLHRGSRGVLLALITLISGCASMHFSYHATRATRGLEQARNLDAEELSPYHFTLAELYLDKAHEEAGRAEFQDAVELARAARDEATEASREAQEKRASRTARNVVDESQARSTP